MNNKIKIITDNGCDFETKWLEEHNVHTLKFGLIIDDVEYEGDTNNSMSTDEFYKMLENGALPKTNQITPFIARKHMELFLKEGYDILYLSFSSGLSGSFGSVKIATMGLNDDYPNQKIRVVDTLCASLGQGLLIDYVVRFVENGCTLDEAANYAEELKLKIRHEFTVNDLFHLKRGGRVSTTSAIFGSLLSIKPILHVNDEGKLIPIKKVRGRKSAIRKIFDMFIEHNDINDDDPIFVSHANCLEDAQKLVDMIKSIKPLNRIYINFIGPIIGAHAGQGTIALFYKGKTRMEF